MNAAQPQSEVRILRLEDIRGTSLAGPQYAHWVDPTGRRSFCMIGLSARRVAREFKPRVGETWQVRCREIDPSGRAFGFDGLGEMVTPDPMRRPQPADPVFLPPSVSTRNNTLPAPALPAF